MLRLLRAVVLAVLGAGVISSAAQAVEPTKSAQEAADEKVVMEVNTLTTFEALARSLPRLRAVLDHAPASFPMVVQQGELTIIHDDGQSPAFTLALLVRAAAEKRATSVVRAFNTYPLAAMLLAAYANEMKHPEEALGYLDRGLKMQPDNSRLVSEKAAALFTLQRAPEALSLVSQWLDQNPFAGDDNRARLFRSKGFALTELKQLDAAEAAYRESLKLAPGHPGALHELEYLAKLKAGGAQTNVELVTSEKAAKGDFNTAPADQPPKP